MKLVYTEDEVSKIDCAIPMEFWKDFEPFYHVMNYNEPNQTFGKLEDMREIAKDRNINIEDNGQSN